MGGEPFAAFFDAPVTVLEGAPPNAVDSVRRFM